MKGWSRMKKFTALLVSLLVILSCAAVFAADVAQGPRTFTEEERAAFLEAVGIEVPDEAALVPDESACPACLQGTFEESVHFSSWQATGKTRVCPDNWQYQDYEEQRIKIYEYNCNVCPYGYTTQETEYQWVHAHP